MLQVGYLVTSPEETTETIFYVEVQVAQVLNILVLVIRGQSYGWDRK